MLNAKAELPAVKGFGASLSWKRDDDEEEEEEEMTKADINVVPLANA